MSKASSTVIFITILINLCLPFSSQCVTEKMSIHHFIADAVNKKLNHNYQLLTKESLKFSGHLSFFNKVDLRYRHKDFSENEQVYSIRFYPGAIGEKKYRKLMVDNIRNIGELKQQNFFRDELVRRYHIVLDYLEVIQILDLNKKLLLLIKGKVNVLKSKLKMNINNNMNAIIAEIEREQKIKIKIADLEKRRDIIEKQMIFMNDKYDEVGINDEQMIQIEKIGNLIDVANNEKKHKNKDLEFKAYEKELAENRYLIEKAKARGLIDFFQISYGSEHHHDMNKAVSAEVGISLPFFVNDGVELYEKKYDYHIKRLQMIDQKRTYERRVNYASNSLIAMIEKYNSLMKDDKRRFEGSFPELYANEKNVEPTISLKIKESRLNRKIESSLAKYEILRRYIQFVDLTGMINEKPIRNYLSEQMEEIY